MTIRKNFFYYFAVLVYIFCLLFSIVCVFNRIGEGQEYPYLMKGVWLIGMFVFLILLMLFWTLWSRLDFSGLMKRIPKVSLVMELVIVLAIIIAGTLLRYWVVHNFPMEPASDYKTYYEMAVMIHDGTLMEEGPGYCDYVAMFPHVYGYPAVLAWFFGIFGPSVHSALIFNLIVSVLSMILVWAIARLAGGRFCALTALFIYTFLPSVILYSDFVASEPLFTLILLLAAYLFLLSLKETEWKKKHPWFTTIEIVLMGVTLAFGSFIRPMAMIFLVAAIICMLPIVRKEYDIPINDVPLGIRATDTGWKRCLILLVVYMGLSRLFTMGTSYAVDRELAGSSASFGYNLLVGLNLESYGGWNQEDADYLYDAFYKTGSAQEAQLICRDMAFERLKVDPRALLNLFVHKFDVLWGNDDYGASWNILFMDQQKNLTEDRESLLYRMMDVSDLIYLVLLLEAGIYGFVMFRLQPNGLYSCTLLYLGTAALHLLVENQNRYHYHALAFLAILAGAAGAAMKQRMHVAVMARIEAKKREKLAEEERKAHVRKLQEEEAERVRLRAQALNAQFDMGKAISEGHIRIVARKAIEGAYAPQQAVPQTPAADEKPEAVRTNSVGHEAENLTVRELEMMAEQDEQKTVSQQNPDNDSESKAAETGYETNPAANVDAAQPETELNPKDELGPETPKDSSGMSENSAAEENSSHMNTESDVNEG